MRHVHSANVTDSLRRVALDERTFLEITRAVRALNFNDRKINRYKTKITEKKDD